MKTNPKIQYTSSINTNTDSILKKNQVSNFELEIIDIWNNNQSCIF